MAVFFSFGVFIGQPTTAAETLNYSHGTYVGDTLNGKAHGFGTYTSKQSGTKYTGQFVADTFSGNGKMVWTSGAKYVGQWQNDSGVSGSITYPNGTTAVGTVRNALFYAAAQQPQAMGSQQQLAPQQGLAQTGSTPTPTNQIVQPTQLDKNIASCVAVLNWRKNNDQPITPELSALFLKHRPQMESVFQKIEVCFTQDRRLKTDCTKKNLSVREMAIFTRYMEIYNTLDDQQDPIKLKQFDLAVSLGSCMPLLQK